MFGADVHLRHYGPKTFRSEFENAGFKVREVITKGLDVQHIETITQVYKDEFSKMDLNFLFDNKSLMQESINSAGKGDNLRLFAQK